MAQLVKLWDEKDLLVRLRDDTVLIVQNCLAVPPMKKLIECHDILDLTINIQLQFPTEFPDPPVCDEDALLHLKRLVQEVYIYHRAEVPMPHFISYESKVTTLLRIFRLPKGDQTWKL